MLKKVISPINSRLSEGNGFVKLSKQRVSVTVFI